MNGAPPQFVLTVPPEVIRLLTGILSGVQRVEAELREIKQRLAWARPGNDAETPSVHARPRESGDAPRPAVESSRADTVVPLVGKLRGKYRLSHTPAGAEASKRMRDLLARTALSGVKLAMKLDTHQTTVSMIVRGRLGISHRLDRAMTKLEGRA